MNSWEGKYILNPVEMNSRVEWHVIVHVNLPMVRIYTSLGSDDSRLIQSHHLPHLEPAVVLGTAH